MNPFCYFIFFGIFTLLDLTQYLVLHATRKALPDPSPPSEKFNLYYFLVCGLLGLNFAVYLSATITLITTRTNFSVKTGVKITFIALGFLTLLSGIGAGVLTHLKISKLLSPSSPSPEPSDVYLVYMMVNWVSTALASLLNVVFISTLMGETTTKRPRYVMIPYGYH